MFSPKWSLSSSPSSHYTLSSPATTAAAAADDDYDDDTTVYFKTDFSVALMEDAFNTLTKTIHMGGC